MPDHPFTLRASSAAELCPPPHPSLRWDSIQAVIEDLARDGFQDMPRAWPADMDRAQVPLAMMRLKKVLVPLGYEVSLTPTGFLVSWRECLPHERFQTQDEALQGAASNNVVHWCPVCGGWHCVASETYRRLAASWADPGRPYSLEESFAAQPPVPGPMRLFTQAQVLGLLPQDEG